NGHEFKRERFRLDIRTNFLLLRTVKQRKRLPSETVLSPSLEVFKAQLDQALNNLV
ncbi:hypothetical protein N308_02155, partial [Struthio camelus australis]